MRNALNWWLVALSGGVMSCLLILLTHAQYSKPLWLYAPVVAGEQGTEPLWSSLMYSPYVLRGAGPTPQDYATYQGMLLCAIVVSGVAFNAWLVSLHRLQQYAATVKFPTWKKILPLVLLLPFAVHWYGMKHYWAENSRRYNVVIRKYHAEARARRQRNGQVTEPPSRLGVGSALDSAR